MAFFKVKVSIFTKNLHHFRRIAKNCLNQKIYINLKNIVLRRTM